MKKYVIFLLLMATMASLAYAYVIKGRAEDMAFRIDRLEAEADTARDITDSLQAALGFADSTLNVFQQRIVQVSLEKDSIDEALQEESALRIAAELRMDTVFITDTVFPVIAENDSVRTYAIDGQQGPFRYTGDSRLFPNFTQVFNLVISADPVPVSARVTCADGGIVRRASLLLEAPDPWTLVPSSVQQDPDVCNAGLKQVRFRWLPEISPKGLAIEVIKAILYWRAGEWLEEQIEGDEGPNGYIR